ncbi:MAG TPA: hypothetical protein VMB52_05580 [Verrucomicrobiae bacterium]|nr:hypothetical protein [Verrucomicrobiae bacterium]
MYEGNGGKGAGPIVAGGGAILLPNTGGNSLLTIVAITAIVVGVAIMISTAVRFALKRVYKA